MKSNDRYFRLANHVFTDPILRTLTADTFKVFLWMCMQVYGCEQSDGNLRASARTVSLGIGIAESSVTRSFYVLLKCQLIKRIEVNCKLGNLWWVSPIAFGEDRAQCGEKYRYNLMI